MRSKILLVLLGFFLAHVLLSSAIHRYVILPGFADLELQEAREDMRRCSGVLDAEVQQLSDYCLDWASWDGMYRFVENRNPQFSADNMVESTFIDQRLNLLFVVDREGGVVWGRVCDTTADEELVDLESTSFPLDRWAADHPLRHVQDSLQSAGGVMLTDLGPVLVVSQPILTSEGEGPCRGILVFGRLVDEALIARLSERTRVDLEVFTIGDNLPARQQAMMRKLRTDHSVAVEATSGEALESFCTYAGLDGRAALLLQAHLPRHIKQHGRTTAQIGLLSTITIGLVLLLVLRVLLQQMVLGPLGRLTSHVQRMREAETLAERLDMDRHDEIGTLADEFDRMVDRLAQAQARLMEQSYQSGVAEMASGVLHNVRNALTPITSEIEHINRQIGLLPLSELQRARTELAAPDCASERRDRLSEFVQRGTESLAELIQTIQGRLEHVSFPVAQVEKMLLEQDRQSRSNPPLESFRPADVLQDARALVSRELIEGMEVRIEAAAEGLPPIRSNRIVLLQVFSNLFINAAEAIRDAGIQRGRISVTGRIEDTPSGRVIHLNIQDNGPGIAPEYMDRIFEARFSTKTNSNWGLGLHWCSNAMRNLGGRIRAEAAPGGGACFHVEVPATADQGNSSNE